MPNENKMAASQDTAGFKLFLELYKKKRAKDGRRALPKKEFDEKISAHWKALTPDKHKRYVVITTYKTN